MKCPKCQSKNSDTARFCSNCATALTPPAEAHSSFTKTIETLQEELATGSVFANRYQVIEELGKGGMGKVYRVLDKKLNEEVALKLIRPEIASDIKNLERFKNELKLARKVLQKNVGRMFDIGEELGTHYITMEYVPGEDLKSFIRRVGQISVRKTISIAKQLCEGLSGAHDIGIIHRDLKPSNIMIDKEGNARIMDFGIARSLEGKGITGEGAIIGTPEYMSPEQVEGEETDQRSDIYSLGVILYEMLTGRLPFEGDTPLSIAIQHRSGTPKDPREFNAQIPEGLSTAILKCLEKDGRKRYLTTEKLLREFMSIEETLELTDSIFLQKKLEKKTTEETQVGKSIAVLPFADLSHKKDQEYFCDGMTEELINSLSIIKNLKVVARTSAFSFKGKDIDIRTIGKELNVDVILEGSVRRAGDRLRIAAQLINVEDGYSLWTEQYDREFDDVLAIQDEISLAIVEKLKIKLLDEEKASLLKRHPENLEAYNLYLKGKHFIHRLNAPDLKKAINYFEQAIKKVPDYAQAYVGLAHSYSNMGTFYFLPIQEAAKKAKEAAKKALEINEELAGAHSSLGLVKLSFDWDWDGAKRDIQRAIEICPNSVNAHGLYAGYLAIMGRLDDAIAEHKKALRIDPISVSENLSLGMCLLRAKKLEQARKQLQKTFELEPQNFFTLFILGQAYILSSRFGEGIAKMKMALDVSNRSPIVLAALGWSYIKCEQRKDAQKILDELKRRSERENIAPFLFVKILSALDDIDQAFDWLEKAYDERDISIIHIKTDETIDNLRADPRYMTFLRKMRLEK